MILFLLAEKIMLTFGGNFYYDETVLISIAAE